MKSFLKFLLKYYLKIITKICIFLHKPMIIAVAGSINKPFVKETIKNILNKEGIRVRANPKNFNTEIGLPLAILGLKSGYNFYIAWLPIIFKAPLKIFKKLPPCLVLELGTSDPGDMKYLLTIVIPEVSIITDITQRYLESFGDYDLLAEEFKILIRRTKANGLLILNFDNNKVKELSKYAQSKTCFFGLKRGADYWAESVQKTSSGQDIVVNINNTQNNYHIDKFGNHHVNALLISLAVKKYVQKKTTK